MPLLVLALLVTGGCSGGSKKSGSAGKPASCALIAQLDTIVATVSHADISDPDAFNKTLNTAVTKYVDTVRQLKAVTPATLQSDLDRLTAAVDQERFSDATDARASLDEYALTACGRPLPTIASATTVPTTATATTVTPLTTSNATTTTALGQ